MDKVWIGIFLLFLLPTITRADVSEDSLVCSQTQMSVIQMSQDIQSLKEAQSQYFMESRNEMAAFRNELNLTVNIGIRQAIGDKITQYKDETNANIDQKLSAQNLVPPIFFASLFCFAAGYGLALWRQSKGF